MIKAQDFATKYGVTDRQVLRLIKKHEDELAGHFERQGSNGTWIDETGEKILRSKMRQAPIVLQDSEAGKEIADLEAENKRLNQQLGAQGIIIGQMHQEISALQQFKLDALVEKKALEASKEAQDRREQELARREEQMTQELAEAVQKASEGARAAEEAKYTQILAEAEKRAQSDLTAAHDREKERIREAWHHYRIALEIYEDLPWWKKRKRNKPIPPADPEPAIKQGG